MRALVVTVDRDGGSAIAVALDARVAHRRQDRFACARRRIGSGILAIAARKSGWTAITLGR